VLGEWKLSVMATLAMMESLTVGRVLEIALWVGLAVVSIALLVLLGTSWGHSKPLQKCTILSLLVHVLLAFYAMTVRFQTAGGPGDDHAVVSVTYVEHSDESSDKPDARADSNPWDTVPTEDVSIEMPAMPDVAELADEEFVDEPDEMQPLSEASAEINIDVSSPPLLLPNDRAAAEMPQTALPALPVIEVAAAAAIEVPLPEPEPGQPLPNEPDDAADVAEAPLPNDPIDSSAPTLDEIPLPSDEPDALADIDAAVDSNETSADALDPAAVTAAQPPPLAFDELTPADVDATVDPAAMMADQAGTAEAAVDGSQAVAAESAPELAAVAVDPTARQVPDVYRLRVAPNRDELARARGATTQSEGSVAAALAWLANNQEADGGWNARRHAGGRERSVLGRQRLGYDGAIAGVRADSGVSGLALLAFLGSGHTHTREGPYRETVQRGLNYIRSIQAADGNLAGNATTYAHMYCHGMAAFALSEAYAMTGDQAFAESVGRAARYSLDAQNPYSGGWRYLPWRQRPDDRGDTSQLGWQLMALKSAQLAGVGVPETSHRAMLQFLQSVQQGQHDGLASYRPGEPASPSMTAEALVCRLFLGSRLSQQATIEATDWLARNAPGTGEMNLYFWYYGTLGLYQTQGEPWQRWNAALQETLTRTQVATGDWAGTWPTDDVWGGYGGRVYTTAMGALCLEVYYRFLPLYVETAQRDVQRR
jgi:hypothetical protein